MLAMLLVTLGDALKPMAGVGLFVGRGLCKHPKLTRPHQLVLV